MTAYNRAAAVAYAKTWWNSANPAFPSFKVDCTNFVSQCLLAGGAKMNGYPNRSTGWWYQNNNWSFSWSVAHSLRWYLQSSPHTLKAKRVASASELMIGDVIFYDFTGDGRIDHSTMVTSVTGGIPHIHAHTSNSANRPYHYRDSPAYSAKTTYYYFHILSV